VSLRRYTGVTPRGLFDGEGARPRREVGWHIPCFSGPPNLHSKG